MKTNKPLRLTPHLALVSLCLSAGTADAKPKPLPDWAVAIHDMRSDEAEPLYTSDVKDELAVGKLGTLSFWARADWDDEHCDDLKREHGSEWPKYKYVYSNGSVKQARFRVAFHCDRRTILLEGDSAEELRLPKGLRGSKSRHVVLQTDADGTTIWIDGEAVGSMPVRYGSVKRVPVNVGSSANGKFPWLGVIGGLRVFKTVKDVAQIEKLKALPYERLASSRAYGDLVGYLGKDGSAAKFKIKTASFDPTGRWIGIADVSNPQTAIPSKLAEQNDFLPKPVTTVIWTRRCSRHVLAAKIDAPVDETKCNEPVLAVMTSNLWRRPEFSVYVPKGAGRFERMRDDQSTDGSKVLEVRKSRSGAQLVLEGRTLVKPESKDADAEFTDAWTKQVENFEALSKSVDVRTLDLRFATSSPQQLPIFAMLPDEVGKRYRHIDNLAAPYGSYASSDAIQCQGASYAKEMTSTSEILDELEKTYSSVQSQEKRANASAGVAGVGGASGKGAWGNSLGNNEGLNRMSKNLEANEQSLIRQEARCTGYVFMLDPVRLELNGAFLDAVDNLRRTVSKKPEAALRAFVSRTGTHYANAVTFGGIASLETKMSKRASDYARALAEHTGTDSSEMVKFDAKGSMQIKVVDVGGGGGQTKEQRASQAERTNNMKRQLSSLMTSSTKWETRGGVGGANFESWSSGGVQVPIYLQLRPITELLAPPFFTDPEVIFDLRDAVEEIMKAEVLKDIPAGADRPFLTSSILPKQKWGAACPNLDIDCKSGFICRNRSAKTRQAPKGPNWCFKPPRSIAKGHPCKDSSECGNGVACSEVTKTCGDRKAPVCPKGWERRYAMCKYERNPVRRKVLGKKCAGKGRMLKLDRQGTVCWADCPRNFIPEGINSRRPQGSTNMCVYKIMTRKATCPKDYVLIKNECHFKPVAAPKR